MTLPARIEADPTLRSRRTNLTQAIQAFSVDSELQRSVSSYVITNDRGMMYSVYRAANLLERQSSSADKLKLGVIVGTGAWQSLPEIYEQLDLLLFCDYNPFVAEWLQRTQDIFRQAEYAHSYSRLLRQDSLWSEIGAIKNYSPDNGETVEINSLDLLHFLARDRRYGECRTAYLRTLEEGKAFIPVTLDLADADSTACLGAIINNQAEVTFANFTNIAQHVVTRRGKAEVFCEALQMLPFRANAVILHSSAYGPQSQDPVIGLETYMQKAIVSYARDSGYIPRIFSQTSS